jgi:LPXTG-motif cell wall-anchored protein
MTAVLTLAVNDLVSDLIESGDVEQLLALIATLDQLDADVLTDADVAVMLSDVLDGMLAELVVAIEGETLDLESLRLLLTGLLESEVFGDELVLRFEAGELDASLAAVVQEFLESEGAPGAPGDGAPTAPEAPGTEAPISEAPTTSGAPTAETSERPTTPEAPSDETRSLQAPTTTAGAAATAQPTDQLPRTGAEALQLALLAMVALAAGTLLLLTTQRRRLHVARAARDGA